MLTRKLTLSGFSGASTVNSQEPKPCRKEAAVLPHFSRLFFFCLLCPLKFSSLPSLLPFPFCFQLVPSFSHPFCLRRGHMQSENQREQPVWLIHNVKGKTLKSCWLELMSPWASEYTSLSLWSLISKNGDDVIHLQLDDDVYHIILVMIKWLNIATCISLASKCLSFLKCFLDFKPYSFWTPSGLVCLDLPLRSDSVFSYDCEPLL